MKKIFFIYWLSMAFGYAEAQTAKPAVLIVGNGNAAVAAGIQAAVSGVKTTLLLQADAFDIHPPEQGLSSGLQAELLKKINHLNGNDSLSVPEIDKQSINDLLFKWTDTIKNLTVIRKATWIKAERSGKNWSFKLSNGQAIKPRVLIIAGDTKLAAALKLPMPKSINPIPLNYGNDLYRTSVSTVGNNAVFSMYDFFVDGEENLLWLDGKASMLIGQAAGATASYAGFFDTKTSLSNLKAIQGELLNYKLALMPFADVKTSDPNWKAIQMVGITGIIKAAEADNGANFLPEQLVATNEIKQPVKDFFYKAQIWFDDYKKPEMTIGAATEMICYVGNKAYDSTLKEMEKKWKQTYKFTGNFDLSRPITRRELAVLLQDYMPPFNVNIDKTGKVVR